MSFVYDFISKKKASTEGAIAEVSSEATNESTTEVTTGVALEAFVEVRITATTPEARTTDTTEPYIEATSSDFDTQTTQARIASMYMLTKHANIKKDDIILLNEKAFG